MAHQEWHAATGATDVLIVNDVPTSVWTDARDLSGALRDAEEYCGHRLAPRGSWEPFWEGMLIDVVPS